MEILIRRNRRPHCTSPISSVEMPGVGSEPTLGADWMEAF